MLWLRPSPHVICLPGFTHTGSFQAMFRAAPPEAKFASGADVPAAQSACRTSLQPKNRRCGGKTGLARVPRAGMSTFLTPVRGLRCELTL
jgi:hypothetical protein